MSKRTYNNQTINEYLLGSLPEAESERLDELSFTDDEFAETLRAAEKDLVDAYVQGELVGAALERFKSHYLSTPRRRGKVKFAQALRLLSEKEMAAQASGVRAGAAEESAAKRKGSGWFSALSVFASARPALRWGAGLAALVLLVAGVWLAFEDARLRGQLSQTQARQDALARREQELQKELEGRRSADDEAARELASVREERARLEQELKQQAAQEQQRAAEQQRPVRQQQLSSAGVSIASFVLAPQMRGAGQIPTVSVPSESDYVAMRLELEPGEHAAYTVALLEQSNNRVVWRSRQLKARAAGDGKALNVGFRAGLLRPRAVYVLRVTGVAASGASEVVGDYPFRVVE